MNCNKNHGPTDYADFKRMTKNIRPWPDLDETGRAMIGEAKCCGTSITFIRAATDLETHVADVADHLLGLQEVAPSADLLDRISDRCVELRMERDKLKTRVCAWREAAYAGKRILEYVATGELSPDATQGMVDGYNLTWTKARALDSSAKPSCSGCHNVGISCPTCPVPVGNRAGASDETDDAPMLCAFQVGGEICAEPFPHTGDHVTAEGVVIA